MQPAGSHEVGIYDDEDGWIGASRPGATDPEADAWSDALIRIVEGDLAANKPVGR